MFLVADDENGKITKLKLGLEFGLSDKELQKEKKEKEAHFDIKTE